MRMGRGGIVMLLTGALVVATGPLSAGAQESDFEWSGSIAPGSELEVRGISGDIHVVLARGDRVEVTAKKRGRRGDFDDVEVIVEEGRYGVTICAVYFPSDRGSDRCDGHGDSRGNRWRGRDIDVSVDFEVALPEGVEFNGATVSGDIDIESVRSDVRATTVSGDITASTSGIVEATSVNGELDLEIGSTDWDDLEFATVSGDISLTLPASAETEVSFSSLSGDFDTDFDVQYTRQRERWVGSSVQGVIGDDRRSLAFKTVSGDVRLHRAGR